MEVTHNRNWTSMESPQEFVVRPSVVTLLFAVMHEKFFF